MDQPFASSEMDDSIDLFARTLCGYVGGGHGICTNLRREMLPTGSDRDYVCSIPAGRDLGHGTQVGIVWSGPGVLGVCGTISGAVVLMAAVRESVGGHEVSRLWRRRAPPAMASQLVHAGL